MELQALHTMSYLIVDSLELTSRADRQVHSHQAHLLCLLAWSSFIDDYRVNQVWCVEPDSVQSSHDRVALIPT